MEQIQPSEQPIEIVHAVETKDNGGDVTDSTPPNTPTARGIALMGLGHLNRNVTRPKAADAGL